MIFFFAVPRGAPWGRPWDPWGVSPGIPGAWASGDSWASGDPMGLGGPGPGLVASYRSYSDLIGRDRKPMMTSIISDGRMQYLSYAG